MSASSPSLDYRRIAAEITARHGICVKPDDPFMAAATLLELVLEDSGKRLTSELQQALEQFTSAAERIQIRSGAALAEELKEATAALRREFGAQVSSTTGMPGVLGSVLQRNAEQIAWPWLMAGWISAALLFGCGFLAGWISRSW
jgi:hypothetical protein